MNSFPVPRRAARALDTPNTPGSDNSVVRLLSVVPVSPIGRFPGKWETIAGCRDSVSRSSAAAAGRSPAALVQQPRRRTFVPQVEHRDPGSHDHPARLESGGDGLKAAVFQSGSLPEFPPVPGTFLSESEENGSVALRGLPGSVDHLRTNTGKGRRNRGNSVPFPAARLSAVFAATTSA